MDPDEGAAIALYKEYQIKHLPEARVLYDLVAPNFDPSVYSEYDEIGALRKYLDELKPYVAVLSRAAFLREQHYMHFLHDDQLEDVGHRNWRLGMNDIARDAREKLEYWTFIHDKLLDVAIAKYDQAEQRSHIRTRIDMMSRNVDRSEAEQQKDKQKRVTRPRMSKAEVDRRNAEYREFLHQKKIEEDLLLEKTVEEMKEIRAIEEARRKKQEVEDEVARIEEENKEMLRLREMDEDVACSNPVCSKLASLNVTCKRCLICYCSNKCSKQHRTRHKKVCKKPDASDMAALNAINHRSVAIISATMTNRLKNVRHDETHGICLVDNGLGRKVPIDDRMLGVPEGTLQRPESHIVSIPGGKKEVIMIAPDVFEAYYKKRNEKIECFRRADGVLDIKLPAEEINALIPFMVAASFQSITSITPENLWNKGVIVYRFDDYTHFLRCALLEADYQIAFDSAPSPMSLQSMMVIHARYPEDICVLVQIGLSDAHLHKNGFELFHYNRMHSLRDLIKLSLQYLNSEV